MLRHLPLIVLLLAVSGCRAAPVAAPAVEFRPTATVQDVMDSVVDPSADAVWESVATISTQAGVEERQPRTDEEWASVRRHGITLMEATNLLLMDRRVAKPGAKPTAGEELPPEEIEKRIKSDPAAWATMVHGLNDAVQPALRAIEARNPMALQDAGAGIDEACENCHKRYRYPDPPALPGPAPSAR